MPFVIDQNITLNLNVNIRLIVDIQEIWKRIKTLIVALILF
jgi:hypothetical protein